MTESKSSISLPWECKPFIIADIGSNYIRHASESANFLCAVDHIKDCSKAGVHAVKFQLFTHKELYGFDGDDTYAMPRRFLPLLADECKQAGVEFMCSAFSAEGVREVNEYVNIHKVASAEMLDVSILEAVKEARKPWILSTGGAHLNEVIEVVEQFQPSVVLECVAAYPAEAKDYCLGKFAALHRATGITWGVSDHATVTARNPIPTRAVGMGATVFEFHYTTMGWPEKKSDVTPDYEHSVKGSTWLGMYVSEINDAYQSQSQPKVGGRECEKEMALKWRRRIKATRDIKAGEMLIRGENYGFYRSKTDDPIASAPPAWVYIEGKPAVQDYKAFDGIYAGPYADK